MMDTLGEGPLPVLGHSKGGGVMVQLAASLPYRVRPGQHRRDAVAAQLARRSRPPAHEDDGVRADGVARPPAGLVDAQRKPGTIDELAARRGRMNPRLSRDWLRYLVTVGGRRDPDGWRWKIDPVMRPGGLARGGEGMARLPGLSMPLLGILAGNRR